MTRPPNTTRQITHAEARDVARRLIAGAFRRDGERLEDDARPRFGTPTRVDYDDDCLIVAYIEQREAADLVGAHEAEEARVADGNVLKRPSFTDGFRPVGETWVSTLRREGGSVKRHALGVAGIVWCNSAFALAAALDEQTARADRLEGDLYRMSLDELVLLRDRTRNCTEVVFGSEATS